MKASLSPVLEQLGRGIPVSDHAVGGGCIADARMVEFSDGSTVFLKSGSSIGDMFEREAEGLNALGATGALRVPRVLAVTSEALVLEHIHSARKTSGFFEVFGCAFARLHATHGKTCGFPHDNYIGSTQQQNTPVEASWSECAAQGQDGSTWPAFFLERRLRFQAQLAARRGHGEDLLRMLDLAEPTIDDLLRTSREPPALLHGDLWSGNFIVDEKGEPVLIDPAVYYGHREADLAMTHLFGGFGRDFYESYENEWPLQAGHRDRLPVYQLYHLLNHLNLFGSSYYGQCQSILSRYS